MTTTARTTPAARATKKTGKPAEKAAQPAPGSVAPEVTAYLAALPEVQRQALLRLREAVRAVVPDATEVISYGIPMFKQNGKGLVAYNATASGCTLQVMSSAVLRGHAAQLTGFRTGVGSIRFAPERPLPRRLLAQIVRERIAENDRPKQR